MAADIKNKTIDELLKLLTEKKENLRSFRFGITGSKTRNVRDGVNLRHEIARIMTELQKRA
jgi:ribosomal protein L29